MRGNRLCISTPTLATGAQQGPDDQPQATEAGGNRLVANVDNTPLFGRGSTLGGHVGSLSGRTHARVLRRA